VGVDFLGGDRGFRRTGLGVAMLCVSTAGVFVTIPETGAVSSCWVRVRTRRADLRG